MPPEPLRISAVIPTYNRGTLVSRAVRSALEQSRPPDELIVVDDGSSDDTAERLEPYRDRIRYVRQANAGGSAARNRGVADAVHPWVAFLDSDDYWRPRHLERMDAAIGATGGAARFYFGDTLGSASEGGRPFWELAGLSVAGTHELAPDGSDWVMRAVQPMMLQSTVFRRRDYLAVRGLSERVVLRHDTLLFLQLGLGRPACAVTGCGAVMTADDDTPVRLTTSHNEHTPRYWEDTVLLYQAALRVPEPLSAAHGRQLRRRLAMGRLRLARQSFADGRHGRGVAQLARGALTSPSLVADRVGRRLSPRAPRTPS